MPKEHINNIIQYDSSTPEHLTFMKDYVREFYDTKLLTWQYIRSDSDFNGLFFYRNEDKYIASQGMIPIFLTVQGNPILTVKSESSFLHSDFRRQGIFETLYFDTILSAEKAGAELVWGFTALSKVWRNKLHFDVEDGIVQEAVIQINAQTAIKEVKESQGSFVERLKRVAKIRLKSMKQFGKLKKSTNYTISTLDFGNSMDKKIILNAYALWSESHQQEIFIMPSEGYFNWRLEKNPMLKYEFISISNEGELLALAIVNTTLKSAYLVDFIVISEEDTATCLRELIHYLKHNRVMSNLWYWANSLNATNKLVLAEFAACGALSFQNTEMNLVLKRSENCSIPREILMNPANYYLNGLWTEGFRI
ncbi:MAG: hypothetical protein ACI837_000347 [Crocinitomicaceae bacterium]|jgi:hypothetical protein